MKKALIYAVLIILLLLGVGLIMLKSIKGGWKTYSNARFGYSINYPSDWKGTEEAANGDGRPLYRDENNEILVYASNMSSDFSNLGTDLDRRNITLKDGRRAIEIKNVKDKTDYIVYFNDGDQQYVFYSKVARDFFDKHESEIKTSARSLRLVK